MLLAIIRKNHSVMVDGSSYNFLFYEDGVFSDTYCGCDETSLNHAMLLVGYVAYEESQQSYWILKNRYTRTRAFAERRETYPYTVRAGDALPAPPLQSRYDT